MAGVRKGAASETGAFKILTGLLREAGAPEDANSQAVLRAILNLLYKNGGFLGVREGTLLDSRFPLVCGTTESGPVGGAPVPASPFAAVSGDLFRSAAPQNNAGDLAPGTFEEFSF